METQDPTIEEIVGEENVVDVDSPEESLADFPVTGLICARCSFATHLYSELAAHEAEAHPPKEPVQPELFREPGVVHRMVNVMLPAELLAEKKTRLAGLYQSSLEIKEEKKSTDADCNNRLKNIDEQMQEIARVLKTPFTYEKVDCEWKILESENARGLYRIDTGELLEKQPLTAEDRAEEIRIAEEVNTEPLTEKHYEANLEFSHADITVDFPEVEHTELGLRFADSHDKLDEILDGQPESHDAEFINDRFKNRKKKKVVPEATGTSE